MPGSVQPLSSDGSWSTVDGPGGSSKTSWPGIEQVWRGNVFYQSWKYAKILLIGEWSHIRTCNPGTLFDFNLSQGTIRLKTYFRFKIKTILFIIQTTQNKSKSSVLDRYLRISDSRDVSRLYNQVRPWVNNIILLIFIVSFREIIIRDGLDILWTEFRVWF